MKWGLILTNPAKRSLRMVPAEDIKRINIAFEEMMTDPFSGDIKFLKGTNEPYFSTKRLVIDSRSCNERHPAGEGSRQCYPGAIPNRIFRNKRPSRLRHKLLRYLNIDSRIARA
jgi:hypothetical protein